MKPYGIVLLLSLTFLSYSPAVYPLDPGDLDPSFGTNGTATVSLGSNFDWAYDAAIDSQGRIVVVGHTQVSGSDYDIVLIRFNPDASLDPSFGNGGKVITTVSNDTDSAHAVAIDSDGKIVIAGTATTIVGGISRRVFLVARYLESGALDLSFGTNGITLTPIATHTLSEANPIALQPDGKIVVAGLAQTTYSFFVVARYTSTGALDSSFNNTGMHIFSIGATGWDAASAVSIDPSGRIVVAGKTKTIFTTDDDFAVARLNSNGALDKTFDLNGKVITPIGNASTVANDRAYAVAIDSNGRIVVAGEARNNTTAIDIALVRYKDDGSLDTTFDGNGILTKDIGGGDDAARALILDKNGNLIVAGDTRASDFDYIVLRYLPTAELDLSFGAGGFSTTGIAFSDEAHAVVLQKDSRIVLAGRSSQTPIGSPPNYDFSVARFIGYAADLELEAQASSESVKEGENLTYSITVTNHGPDEALDVVVNIDLPSELTFISANLGSCTGAPMITCQLGSMAAGTSKGLEIVVSAQSEGTFSTSVRTTLSSVYDPTPSNNQVVLGLTVNPTVVTTCSSDCPPSPPPTPSVTSNAPGTVATGGGCSCAINSHNSGQHLNPLFYLIPLVLLLAVRARRRI